MRILEPLLLISLLHVKTSSSSSQSWCCFNHADISAVHLKVASMVARSDCGRITDGPSFAPNTAFSASIIIDFPAPVSPVSTLKPHVKGTRTCSTKAKSFISSSKSIHLSASSSQQYDNCKLRNLRNHFAKKTNFALRQRIKFRIVQRVASCLCLSEPGLSLQQPSTLLAKQLLATRCRSRVSPIQCARVNPLL